MLRTISRIFLLQFYWLNCRIVTWNLLKLQDNCGRSKLGNLMDRMVMKVPIGSKNLHSEDVCLQGRTTDDFMSETMFVFNLATLAIVEMSFLLASVAFRCVHQCLPGPPRPPPAPPPPRAPQDTKGMSRLSPRKRRDRKGKDGEKCVSMWCAQKKRAICKVVPFLDGVICIPYALRLWFHGSIFQARVSFGPFCVFKLPLLLETAHQTNIILQNLELSDALKQNYIDAQRKSRWFMMIYMTVYESLW